LDHRHFGKRIWWYGYGLVTLDYIMGTIISLVIVKDLTP
jgi:hypothetical protein